MGQEMVVGVLVVPELVVSEACASSGDALDWHTATQMPLRAP